MSYFITGGTGFIGGLAGGLVSGIWHGRGLRNSDCSEDRLTGFLPVGKERRETEGQAEEAHHRSLRAAGRDPFEQIWKLLDPLTDQLDAVAVDGRAAKGRHPFACRD